MAERREARRRRVLRLALLRRERDLDTRLRFGLIDLREREVERLRELLRDDRLRDDLRLVLREALDFEAFGTRALRVVLLRDAEREDLEALLLDAFGVRLLLPPLRRETRRRALREVDLFGALGVRARRLDPLRRELLFEALGVLLRRLGVRLRRLGVRLRRLGVRLRFCFFTALCLC